MALSSVDIGAAAENRDFAHPNAWTLVNISNPANISGYITQVTVYTNYYMTGIKVASFAADGNDLTTTGYTSLPNQDANPKTWNAPADFPPFAVNSGDYIGMYWASGAGASGLDLGGTGESFWFLSGDNIPCSSETFSLQPAPNYDLSLYATGYDEIRGWINVGDVWKLIDTWQINIGDAWKAVSNVQQNISDAWKETWLT